MTERRNAIPCTCIGDTFDPRCKYHQTLPAYRPLEFKGQTFPSVAAHASKAFRPGLQAYRDPEPGTLEWYRNLPVKVPYTDTALFKWTWSMWVTFCKGLPEAYPDIQDVTMCLGCTNPLGEFGFCDDCDS
jgi:hypothetical protein